MPTPPEINTTGRSLDNVRIHLDEVEGLGTFLELEAVYDGSAVAEVQERQKLEELMRQLGVAEADLVDTSYEGLLDGDLAAR